MLRETIKQLSKTLDPQQFVRIHRSVIVNVDQVREIFREGQSEGSVVLKSGQRLRMSKAGWQCLLALAGTDAVPGFAAKSRGTWTYGRGL